MPALASFSGCFKDSFLGDREAVDSNFAVFLRRTFQS